MEIKIRYLWKGIWYYISSIKDNLAEFFRVYEIRAKTTPLELWSGLKDKNGEDIYKGDIIKFHNDPKLIHEVIFKNSCFCLREDAGDFYNYDYFNVLKSKEFEIIGNIYEIPELLEVKE